MAIFRAGSTIRFTYNHPPEAVDANTGDRFKEVFVLHDNWQGKAHGIDLKRLTAAEREVIQAVFDPNTKKGRHRLPLVNDILRRMDPLVEIKNPMSFYQKFVKPFIRNKDVYRQYALVHMLNVTVVDNSDVAGGVTNPKPLFHQVESKTPEQRKLDLIRKVAAEKGVGISPGAGTPFKKK